MTTVLPFSNNSIQVYAYEGFDYTLSNPNPALTLQTVSNTSGLDPTSLYFTKNGNISYRFYVPDTSNNLTAGRTESFLLNVVDSSLNVIYSSSNTVSIGAGRFLDASGLSLSNRSYTFYKNETITPIQLVAPSFALKVPVSVPSLPPGLSFVSNAYNIYSIAGTPTVTVPNSNYQIIGVQQGGSKVVTTRINMVVSNERLRLNLSGTPIINNMAIGTAITSRVITAIPPATGGTVRYTFPTFPDGITVTDICGTVQPSPFLVTSDPSYTMIVSGTPTSNAANLFRSLDPSGNGVTYTVQASRIAPTPVLDSSQSLTFSFRETILFDTPTLGQFFSNIPVDASSNFFRARTFFTSNVPITNMYSPDLGFGLSLEFVPGTGTAYLFGTPTAAGVSSFSVIAKNANLEEQTYPALFTISNDSVSFSSPIGADLCYNFILSRPLTQFKTGYYESNVQFVATAASGRAVTLSAPALTGTGLSLSSNGTLTGIPTAVTPLTNLVVTASVTGSPATATKIVKFAILNDTFEFSDISSSSLQFTQNIAITPFQVNVTTLSDRNIAGFTQTGFPSGLSIDPTGTVSGIPTTASPTSGNATITATTGYTTGSRDYSYNITPDSILFTVPQTTYTFTAGETIDPIPVDATAYSGITTSNYTLTLPASYGLSINPTSGLLTGTWTDSIPPNQLLPASCNFTITAQAGGLTGTLPATLTANPAIKETSFVWSSNKLYRYTDTSWTSLTPTVTSFSLAPTPVAHYDFNTYTNQSATISNSISGSVGSATVIGPTSNVFVTTNPTNKYLNIFYLLAGGQGGGLQMPSITNARTIEAWVQYTTRPIFQLPNAVFIDVSSGDTNGFWFTNRGATDADNIGSNFNGAFIYYNTVLQQTATTGTTSGLSIGRSLYTASAQSSPWVQVVIIMPSSFTNDITMFTNSIGGNSFPVSVADVAVYNTALTSTQIQALYNSKCGRYGLSQVVPAVGFDIGFKNSNVNGNFILATSSNYILRSTYNNGFNAIEVGDASTNQNCSSLANVSTTWWCSGTRNYSGTQTANVIVSDDNGSSWSPLSTLIAQVTSNVLISRDSNAVTASSNAYLSAGIALKYKSGVLLAGGLHNDTNGTTMLRSTDAGVTWNEVTGPFAKECAYYNLDGSSVWVATGSDAYKTITVTGSSYGTSTNTIKYSTDNGQSWSNAATGAFNMFGYELIYASNIWVATGVDGKTGPLYDVKMKYSTDGSNWSDVNLGISPDPFRDISSSTVPTAPLALGSMNYDGSNWNVFVQRLVSGNWVSEVYRSPDITSSSWTSTDVTSQFSDVSANSLRRFVRYTRPQYLRSGSSSTIDIVLSFSSSLTNGPAITSPTETSILLYQYINTNIGVTSSGSNVYFFVAAQDLPPGMSFNPTTNIISGKPSQIGRYTTNVYAKDASGVTLQAVTFTVVVPRVIRQQSGAGAYTSLLRQYTDVLAAQSARDSRVLPNQERALGEFMSPVPADVVTRTFSSTKCGICGRIECPAGNISVDGNGVQVSTCSTLDGNATGETFVDAGNAGVNVCE